MKTNYWQKFEEGTWYHVYNRGINSCNIFHLEKNYQYFLGKFEKYLSPYFSVGAYCLMPNHFHFLIKVKPVNDKILASIDQERTNKAKSYLDGKIDYNVFLESQMKRLFSSYSLSFNKQEDRTGSLFQKRFKRLKVLNEPRLMYVLGYIHHNPIHHRFCKHYNEWRHSSYNDFLTNKPGLIDSPEVLSWFWENNSMTALNRFVEYHKYFQITKE